MRESKVFFTSDTHFGEYGPFSLEEVFEILEEQEVKLLDHHVINR